jgi:hypothetical protein
VRGALLAALLLGACGSPINEKACANHPKSFCGENRHCEIRGNQSKCVDDDDAGAEEQPDAPLDDGEAPPDRPAFPDMSLPETLPGNTGQKCTSGADCGSNTCVDGICCAGTCDGKCTSCANAFTGLTDGLCGPVRAGSDPRNQCDKGSDTCGLDGECDGKGACRSAGMDVTCSPETCAGGMYVGPSRCNGAGKCVAPGAISCGTSPCVSGHCSPPCSGSTDCPPGFYCAGTTCMAKQAQGSACTSGSACVSSFCVEGVCCDRACGDKCMSCLAANTGNVGGTCSPVKPGTDPGNSCSPDTGNPCGLDGTCDGSGACRYAPASKSCGAESCSNGSYTGPGSCNGSGSCAAPSPTTCGDFACNGSRCYVICSSDAHCRNGTSCVNGSCGKKPLGATCSGGTECAMGFCVEGVCCNTSCSQACYSCRQTNTTQADGQCAPVKSGTAHGSDCTTTSATSCGTDGKCDGSGGCRKWPSGTSCGSESCPAGTNNHTSGGSCDGNGSCGGGGSNTCPNNLMCNGSTNKCRTSCGGDGDCVSTYFCSGTSCQARRAPGATCTVPGQCTSNLCGGSPGRCCNPGQPCTCSLPSSANLLKNPGFDSDLGNWSLTGGNGSTTFVGSSDYENCPFSGVVRFSLPGGGGTTPAIEQCVPIPSAGTYYFLIKARSSGMGERVMCQVFSYNVGGCPGSGFEQFSAEWEWLNVDWGPGGTGRDMTLTNGGSVRISCFAESMGTAFPELDMMYFGTQQNATF